MAKPGESDRQVIRKATIELVVPDVRATFLKAGLLISHASGEYAEDSNLTGVGKDAQANLTLRVSAARLSGVLNELRSLGEVRGEKTAGEDVTDQVVDLDARLRNEKRVEEELLQLLEKRDNAPLKEVLDLRDKIAEVRQNIERLTAQRERIGRLVSLATVLVIIRAADAPPPPLEKSGLGDYFSTSMSRAWTTSSRFLVDSLTSLVGVIVGGLMWWLMLLVAVLVIRGYLRRNKSGPTQSS